MSKTVLRLVLLPIVLLGTGIFTPLQGHSEQMEPSEFAQGVEYSLLMSKDDKVCKHMLALFNHDLSKFGTEKYDEHEEFLSIGWKKEPSTSMYGDREVTSVVDAAYIDIDNDGTKDVVIRDTTLFGGYEAHVLYIFPKQRSVERERWTLQELMQSRGRIALYGRGYTLKQTLGNAQKKQSITVVPPTTAGLSVLEPFSFLGTAYISMRALYEVTLGFDPTNESSRIHIIIKYKQGKLDGDTKQPVPQAGQTEDVCYYRVRTKTFVPGGE